MVSLLVHLGDRLGLYRVPDEVQDPPQLPTRAEKLGGA